MDLDHKLDAISYRAHMSKEHGTLYWRGHERITEDEFFAALKDICRDEDARMKVEKTA